jgi:hypothetical protein
MTMPIEGRRGIRKQVFELPMLTEEEVQALFSRQRDAPAVVRGLRKAVFHETSPGG